MCSGFAYFLVMIKNSNQRRPTHIRAWRKYRKLTLEQLAERVDLTAGAISQLERGAISYTQPTLEALADELRRHPADLISRDPEGPEGLWILWERLPERSKHQALAILAALFQTTQ